jgi:uncharacterized protein (DUF983 family)
LKYNLLLLESEEFMPFVLVKYAAVFCSVAIGLALLADISVFLTMLIASHYSEGGFAILLRRNSWIAVLAVWWVASFLISLPVAHKFTSLPFRLF